MAGNLPVYESSLRVPGAPTPGLQPVNVPVADTSAVGKAIEQFGQQATDFAYNLNKGRQAETVADVQTKYLVGLSDLREKYGNSTDFKGAPTGFADDEAKLREDLLGGIADDGTRTKLRLYMTLHGTTAKRVVDTKQLANEADYNTAQLNLRSRDYVTKIASAGSPVERQAIADQWNEDLTHMASAGWISRQDAVRRKIIGEQTVANSDVMAAIRINPQQAAKSLEDPTKFPALGPAQRQQFINQAKAAADHLTTAKLQNTALRDPARAIGTVGLVGRVQDGDAVFSRGILPTENATGDNAAVSPAGAVGISQIMPDTARGVAKQLGLSAFDGLDNAQVTAKLKADKSLNVRLGLTYWRGLVQRYGGRIYVAAAAYNAGPGNDKKPRADAWMREAVQKYGENFTAAQLASVIPIKETRDYVLKVARHLGAPDDGGGLSPAAQFHAASVIGTTLSQDEHQRISAIKDIARVDRAENDPATVMAAGYNADPVMLARYKQDQTLAAQNGDPEAIKALRKVQLQEEMLPFRQKALRTPPAQLAQFVDAETARLAGTPAVSVDQKNRLDIARETLKSVAAARNANVIGLAEHAQLIPPDKHAVIDPAADPRSADFHAALAMRGAQANDAAAFYQGRALALKPQELVGMKERWANAGPDERFNMLDAFGSSLTGNAFRETVKAVAGDSPVMQTIAHLAPTRPELAREILRGGELMKSKEVQQKASAIQPAFSSTLGGQLFPDPRQQKAVEDAALRLYVARTATDHTLYEAADPAGVEKAIEDITGPIESRNGVKTPIAPGIEPARFRSTLDHLSQQDLNLMGGAYDRNGRAMSPADVSRYAVLRPLAIGSPLYVVGMRDARSPDGFAPLFTASALDGGHAPSPLVFNMRALTTQPKHAAAVVHSGTNIYQRAVHDFNNPPHEGQP